MTQKHHSSVTIFLAFLVLRTLLALILEFSEASAKSNCYPFADHVLDKKGVNAVGHAACRADHDLATVGHEPNSFITLDMGIGNEVVDLPGIDIIYYSALNNDGTLSPLEVSIAPADTNGEPIETGYVVVFSWNGGIHNPVIEIDIAASAEIRPDIQYRFVRIQPLPSESEVSEENLVYIDAVENTHGSDIAVPSPTPTPTPTESLMAEATSTPTLTQTPTPTLMSILIYTATETYTSTATASITPQNNLTSTPTPTLAVASTSTATPTSTATVVLTNTPTPTQLLGAVETPTVTPTTISVSTNTSTKTQALYTPTQLDGTVVSSNTLNRLTETSTPTYTSTPLAISSYTPTNQLAATVPDSDPSTQTPPISIITVIMNGSKEGWQTVGEWWDAFIKALYGPETAGQTLVGLLVGGMIAPIWSALKKLRKYLQRTSRRLPIQIVNINTANKKTLRSLPGIGSELAEEIINYRTQHGPFTSIDGLNMVPGIGSATINKLRGRVRL